MDANPWISFGACDDFRGIQLPTHGAAGAQEHRAGQAQGIRAGRLVGMGAKGCMRVCVCVLYSPPEKKRKEQTTKQTHKHQNKNQISHMATMFYVFRPPPKKKHTHTHTLHTQRSNGNEFDFFLRRWLPFEPPGYVFYLEIGPPQ